VHSGGVYRRLVAGEGECVRGGSWSRLRGEGACFSQRLSALRLESFELPEMAFILPPAYRAFSSTRMTVSKTRQVLVVGLGNYTHPRTRHSVGQVIVDALAERFQVSLSQERSVLGWFGETELDVNPPPSKRKGKAKQTEEDSMPSEPERVKFTFLKPKLAMNVSGKSVSLALRSRIKPSTNRSVIVIHDSLEHKPLRISPKFSGSANGHNGVRSTIEALGGQDFYRIRIGVGRGVDVASYVLESLSPKEQAHWCDPEGNGVSEVWNAIETIVSGTC